MTEELTIKGRIIALVIGLIVLVLLSEGILRIAMPHWREFHSGRFLKPILLPGHSNLTIGKPGFDGYFAENNGDFRAHISINNFGLRNPEPVTAANNRIWVIGDSMTFGWGVEQNEMYSSVFAQLSNYPTYNIASPGTDVCGYQTLLNRMPDNLKPRAVIVGLILENDIYHYDCKGQAELHWAAPKEQKQEAWSILRIKRFLSKHAALYNFSAIALKRVNFIREALISVGLVNRSHRYRVGITEDKLKQSLDRTTAELKKLRAMLSPDIPFVVLLVPGRFEIINRDSFYRKIRQGMLKKLRGQNISAVDPFSRFMKLDFFDTHFAHDGHWSKKGHALAAEALAEWFKKRGPL